MSVSKFQVIEHVTCSSLISAIDEATGVLANLVPIMPQSPATQNESDESLCWKWANPQTLAVLRTAAALGATLVAAGLHTPHHQRPTAHTVLLHNIKTHHPALIGFFENVVELVQTQDTAKEIANKWVWAATREMSDEQRAKYTSAPLLAPDFLEEALAKFPKAAKKKAIDVAKPPPAGGPDVQSKYWAAKLAPVTARKIFIAEHDGVKVEASFFAAMLIVGLSANLWELNDVGFVVYSKWAAFKSMRHICQLDSVNSYRVDEKQDTDNNQDTAKPVRVRIRLQEFQQQVLMIATGVQSLNKAIFIPDQQ